jgi:DNA-binding transcriptional LysR family regulator
MRMLLAIDAAPLGTQAFSSGFFCSGTASHVQLRRLLENVFASLFMMRTGVEPIWRLRRSTGRGEKVVVPLTPRLLIDDMLSLKQAAIGGLGLVALPGYVCRDDLKSGVLRQVLPDWIADDSTLTALIAYRQGLLPSVRAFIDHLAAELPMSVLI